MGHVLSALEDHARALTGGDAHTLLGTPTLSVGVIEGGQAVNIVPDSCWIEVDRRTMPGERTHDVLGAVKAALARIDGCSMDPPHLEAQGMDVHESSPVVHELCAAVKGVTGTSVVEGAYYATDAGIYNAAGIPSIVFGPGDIADAHTAGESIDLVELQTATAIIRRFLA
jgi:acetylornithine deacetylase